MAGGLDRRPSRSVRQHQAYRAAQAGAVTGVVFVLSTILALAGAIGDGLPIVMLLLTVLCVLRFAQVTGLRGRR